MDMSVFENQLNRVVEKLDSLDGHMVDLKVHNAESALILKHTIEDLEDQKARHDKLKQFSIGVEEKMLHKFAAFGLTLEGEIGEVKKKVEERTVAQNKMFTIISVISALIGSIITFVLIKVPLFVGKLFQ